MIFEQAERPDIWSNFIHGQPANKLPPAWLTLTKADCSSLACTAVKKMLNLRWVAIGGRIQCCIWAGSKSSHASENILGCSSVSEVKGVKVGRPPASPVRKYPRSAMFITMEIWVTTHHKSCDEFHWLYSQPILFFQHQNSSATSRQKLNCCCGVWCLRVATHCWNSCKLDIARCLNVLHAETKQQISDSHQKHFFPTDTILNTRWHCNDECDFFLSRPAGVYSIVADWLYGGDRSLPSSVSIIWKLSC